MKSCKPEKERLEGSVENEDLENEDLRNEDPGTSKIHIKNEILRLHGKISARLDDIPAYYDAAIPVTRLRFFHTIALTGTARLAGPAISNHITPEPF